jgi:PHP domain
MNLLLEVTGTVSPETSAAYLRHSFNVPEGIKQLRVSLRYEKPGICQLYLSVFGPNGYRGSRMLPGAVGLIEEVLEFGEGFGSLGAIEGEIEAGNWLAFLDLERTAYTVDYMLTVEASFENGAKLEPFSAAENGNDTPGWYRGELHSHTHHSDGRSSTAELVAAARRYGLDFLALTDHFTTAAWAELHSLSDEKLCVITSLEMTGHRGHANFHGLREWVNPFVDEPETWSINDAARATRAQGGLVCVNHPFALDLGWRYHEFDWTLCDALEIYHHLEGSSNTAMLTFWDGLLRAGHRISGVAGTDSHDATEGRHRLGQVFTCVYANALRSGAILDGVRAGRAYVTLGPTLAFQATSGANRAGMGEELEANKTVTLEARIAELKFPARVIVMKNGFYHAHKDIATSESEIKLQFHDRDPQTGYYRLEVFALDAQRQDGVGREWQNTLLLSNPIYLR